MQCLQQVQDKNRKFQKLIDELSVLNRFAQIQHHGQNNQYALAMSLIMKEHTTCCGQGPSSYALVVLALTMLSDSEKAKGMGYFDRYLKQ